ncbi:uncharacterized protein LOC124459526 isoform X2 [Xenia sp. Carnegie-2017]|uniref:uncharacterized protein LOC124459526 isoform X2 n=1 Tax=Xenia sp. Carnegie-2017 TaxID=2897299 RepID=UPI001F03894F|nr:uncharacterized protein LOC124459526 isoform X2 [Xenia sp. Carnegie-2017]
MKLDTAFLNAEVRSWTRFRLCIFILVVFFLTNIAFGIMWLYREPVVQESLAKKKNDIYKNAVESHPPRLDILTEFKGTSEELCSKLRSGYRGITSVEYSDSGNSEEDTIVFTYLKTSFPKEIDFSKLKPKNEVFTKGNGYVEVYDRYWEQLTMNLRSFIALAGQAKIGGKRVVEPKVKSSVFGDRNGMPLGTYFYMKHFNEILAASNYATIATHDEYRAECPSDDPEHVNIHFLYSQKGESFTRAKLKLNDKEYDEISAKARKTGWTVCPKLKNFIQDYSKGKQICVNTEMYKNWTKLEKDVIRGAKCVTIGHWRGIGGNYRTHFSEQNFKIKARDIQYALKVPSSILNEANEFENSKIRGQYIAVQVRGERVVIPHDLPRLRSCLRLLSETVNALKKLNDIDKVFVASDMSSYGSGSWEDSLKKELHNENTLSDIHDFLISSIDGIEYKPTRKNLDQGVVALTEMTIISRGRYLLTIGSGSFQEWTKAKFLEHHRHDTTNWSLITMCSK